MWMGLEADWQLYKESERQKANERSREAMLPMRTTHTASTRRIAAKKPMVMSAFGGGVLVKAAVPKTPTPREIAVARKKPKAKAAPKARKKAR
jgi:hypothetical protein